MSLDRDTLYALFEREPGDLAAYGAMADCLDELDCASLAYAYRWMQRRAKWPHMRTHYPALKNTGWVPGRKVPARFRWAWYGEQSWHEWLPAFPESKRSFHDLSSLLIYAEQRVYPSHAAAVTDLAKWLGRLKDVYALDEPTRGL